MNQRTLATAFRELHTQRPLVLPNAWDVASACVIARTGAAALGTTSAGIAWAYGHSDGQQIDRELMLEAIRAIVQSVDLPVTADIESGYGNGSSDDIVTTVHAIIDIGAAGINLEDSPGRRGEALFAPEVQAERINAARRAVQATGGDLVINARTDVFLLGVGAPETRLAEAVRRANLYRAAGADCLFVPGVIDAATIAALVHAIDGPLNIMAMPGAPSIAELGALGVARVSVGPALAQAALATTQQAVHELLDQGTYTALAKGLPFGMTDGMFN